MQDSEKKKNEKKTMIQANVDLLEEKLVDGALARFVFRRVELKGMAAVLARDGSTMVDPVSP
jgi:hypothetical protein